MANVEHQPLRDQTSPFVNRGVNLWDARAAVPGFRAVMGQRFTAEECAASADQLRRDVFARLGSTFDGQDILEIGPGVGRYTPGLADRAKHVIGVDLSGNMLRRARLAVGGRDNVTLLQGSATDIHLQTNRVGGIFEFATLVHIVDDEAFKKAIDEAKRVLAPGGTMVLCGQLSTDNRREEVNPEFVRRPVSAYAEAVYPLRIATKHDLQSLGEDFSMLFIK